MTLNREQVEKLIDDFEIDYKEMVDNSIREHGYTTYIELNLENGEVEYSCYQYNQFPDFENSIILGQIGWSGEEVYIDKGDYNYLHYIKEYDSDDAHYQEEKNIILAKEMLLEELKETELGTLEDLTSLIEFTEGLRYENIDYLIDLEEHLKSCETVDEAENVLNNFIEELENNINDNSYDLFSIIENQAIVDALINLDEDIVYSDERIQEQLDNIYQVEKEEDFEFEF